MVAANPKRGCSLAWTLTRAADGEPGWTFGTTSSAGSTTRLPIAAVRGVTSVRGMECPGRGERDSRAQARTWVSEVCVSAVCELLRAARGPGEAVNCPSRKAVKLGIPESFLTEASGQSGVAGYGYESAMRAKTRIRCS